MTRADAGGGAGAGCRRRALVVAAALAGACTGAWGAEIFLAPQPDPECPCGDGTPPPAPCGTRPDRPLSCWPDADARAASPGDTVTFLDGEHAACLSIDRRGRRRAPFTYRGRTPGAATIRCAGPAEAVRLSGTGIVVEDLGIIAGEGAAAGVRIVAGGAGGRVVLRRLAVEGGRTGIVVEGPGGSLLEEVAVSGAVTGLEIASKANRVRGLRVSDIAAAGVVLRPGADRNHLAGVAIRRTANSGLLVLAGAGGNRLEDSLIAGTGAHGAEIRGSGTTLRRWDISGARYHGVLVAGREAPVSRVRVEACDIHHNGSAPENGSPVGDGVKIEIAEDVRVLDTHISANSSNGILENGKGTRIERCTIDGNGTSRFAHGVYTKGEGGLIRGCRVRGNSGYGLHLWAAPRDYRVEDNEVSGNGTASGGGIVVGGTPSEAPPGRSGLPERVLVRRNRLVGNLGPALDYLLPLSGAPEGCLPGTGGNEFTDNDIIPAPGTLPVRLRGAREGCVRLRGNRIHPAPGAPGAP